MLNQKIKTGRSERYKANASQEYAVNYLAEQLGVSFHAVSSATHATGSKNRKDIEDYLRNKHVII